METRLVQYPALAVGPDHLSDLGQRRDDQDGVEYSLIRLSDEAVARLQSPRQNDLYVTFDGSQPMLLWLLGAGFRIWREHERTAVAGVSAVES